MKEGLRGKHYACEEESKNALMKWFPEQSTEFYEAEIHALIRIWNIERNDDNTIYQPLRSGRIWHKVNF